MPLNLLIDYNLDQATAGNLNDSGAQDRALGVSGLESSLKLLSCFKIWQLNDPGGNVSLADLCRQGHESLLQWSALVHILD